MTQSSRKKLQIPKSLKVDRRTKNWMKLFGSQNLWVLITGTNNWSVADRSADQKPTIITRSFQKLSRKSLDSY